MTGKKRYGVFVNMQDPSEFVQHNLADIQGLVQVVTHKMKAEAHEPEVLGDFLMKLLEGRCRFDPSVVGKVTGRHAAQSTYLYQVVLNVLRDVRRRSAWEQEKRSRAPKVRESYKSWSRFNGDGSEKDLSLDLDNFETLLQRTRWTSYRRTHRQLPLKIFRLLRAGMPSTKIAKKLGITEASVSQNRKYLHRQFQNFRDKVNEQRDHNCVWISSSRHDRDKGKPRPSRTKNYQEVKKLIEEFSKR